MLINIDSDNDDSDNDDAGGEGHHVQSLALPGKMMLLILSRLDFLSRKYFMNSDALCTAIRIC